MRRFAALTICLMSAWLCSAAPEKPKLKSSDDTIDWLLGKSTTAPTSRPASRPTSAPVSPFEDKPNPESRRGTLILNTGQKFSGAIFTTREKPLRLWDDKDKEYRDIPLSAVRSLEA